MDHFTFLRTYRVNGNDKSGAEQEEKAQTEASGSGGIHASRR